MPSKKGTNLECILDVEPAGPADKLNVVGKGTRIQNNCKIFGYCNWCCLYKQEKGNYCLFSVF